MPSQIPRGSGSREVADQFLFNQIEKWRTGHKKIRKVAADVQFSDVENCAEQMRVQKKVLIVDDSPAQVKLIQALLEPEGYWPVGLNDPRRGEDDIATDRPRVSLLSGMLPERN